MSGVNFYAVTSKGLTFNSSFFEDGIDNNTPVWDGYDLLVTVYGRGINSVSNIFRINTLNWTDWPLTSTTTGCSSVAGSETDLVFQGPADLISQPGKIDQVWTSIWSKTVTPAGFTKALISGVNLQFGYISSVTTSSDVTHRYVAVGVGLSATGTTTIKNQVSVYDRQLGGAPVALYNGDNLVWNGGSVWVHNPRTDLSKIVPFVKNVVAQ